MSRDLRAWAAFLAALAVCSFLLFLGGAAAAALPCENRVLTDWSDNGRIDRLYALECYDAAIEAMPADLRDYTDATDVIRRALARAVRAEAAGTSRPGSTQGADAAVKTTGASSLPLPLIVLGAMSLAVLAAGGVGYLSRRSRGSDD
jgi:hypothetical protein